MLQMPGGSRARIPVFASVPSKLDHFQVASQSYVYGRLAEVGLEPRTVGATDRGMYNPLHEVRTLARHCAGGIILGYEQITAKRAFARTRSGAEGLVVETLLKSYHAPTPWNQLETGILFGLGLPLFVLRQEKVTGGVFDEGAADVLVYDMPMPGKDWDPESPEDLKNAAACEGFDAALLRWQSLVYNQYYGEHG